VFDHIEKQKELMKQMDDCKIGVDFKETINIMDLSNIEDNKKNYHFSANEAIDASFDRLKR
jgi:hypothetical protein